MSASEREPAEGAPGRHGLPELIAERRAKAQRLREADAGAFPYSFREAEPVAGILAAYAHLQAGDETEDSHRVAGRIAARRGAGRAAFLDLVDRTGKIQLHVRSDVLGEQDFERVTSLDLGDLIGVEGAALRSRHGGLSPKRLIVGGLERVHELGKDVRNEGASTKHNPEFTMVEFYEAYADYEDEARRLEELVRRAARAVDYAGELDFERPWRRVSFQQAIAEQTGIDVLAHRDLERLREEVAELELERQVEGDTWFLLADDLLSKAVEPNLRQPTFVLDYPVELSPLAREHRSQEGLAERWEAFAGGMEIANAFSELIDPDVQRRRFEAQDRPKAAGVPELMPLDEPFIEALEQEIPPAGGGGGGIDRLVMVLTGRESIREVVLFPAMRE